MFWIQKDQIELWVEKSRTCDFETNKKNLKLVENSQLKVRKDLTSRLLSDNN